MEVSSRIFAMRTILVATAVVFGSAGWPAPALSGEVLLAPQTKLRVTVVQWMPVKGAYEQWPALGGEFVVSEAGKVILPVVGAIEVGTLDTAGLAMKISTQLQKKTGLVNRPDTTIEVIEYPPVYVVGDIIAPGEYKYRAGLTVLQALALGGGEIKSSTRSGQQEIQLVSQLRSLDNDLLRSTARIARLRAEMSGTKDIAFPSVPPGATDESATEIFSQEKIIYLARTNELDRQTKSLSDLRSLFAAEINVLEEKIKSSDEGIKSAEDELAAVRVLVQKGIATASRQSELERTLRGYGGDRLDQMTAIMRARQGITEATRTQDGLRDKKRTEVAAELQKEQANLDQLKLSREMSQKLLLDMVALGSTSKRDDKDISFEITRRENGQPVEIPALESTALLPGDVVKIILGHPPSVDASRNQAIAGPLAKSGQRVHAVSQ